MATEFLDPSHAALTDGEVEDFGEARPHPLSSPRTFAEFLEENDLYFGKREVFMIWSALIQGIPLLLTGPPGVGKTKLAEVISKLYPNSAFFVYQCTEGTSEDDLKVQFVPDERTPSGFRLAKGILPLALELSREKKVVLLLDEIDKTRPSVDAMLLDFLQRGRITVPAISPHAIRGNMDNLVVVMTSNLERELTEPLMRRVAWIDISPPSPGKMREILRKKGGIEDEGLLNLLVTLYVNTLDAGLRKPATVQELIRLARAVELLGEAADWNSLVLTYVIKGEEDRRRFLEWLASRRGGDESGDDEDGLLVSSTSRLGEDEGDDFRPRMPRLPPAERAVASRDAEVTARDEFPVLIWLGNVESVIGNPRERLHQYSSLIKNFNIPPPDVASRLGEFSLIQTGNDVYIVADRILSLGEAMKLYEGDVLRGNRYAFVASGVMRLTHGDIVEVARRTDSTIVYYTRDMIRMVGREVDAFFQLIDPSADVWGVVVVVEHDGWGDPWTKFVESLCVVSVYAKYSEAVAERVQTVLNEMVAEATAKGKKGIRVGIEEREKMIAEAAREVAVEFGFDEPPGIFGEYRATYRDPYGYMEHVEVKGRPLREILDLIPRWEEPERWLRRRREAAEEGGG